MNAPQRSSLSSARIHRVNRISSAHREFWLRRPIEFGFRREGTERVAECTELHLTGHGPDRQQALDAAFLEFERIWSGEASSPAAKRLHALVARVDELESETAPN